MAASHRRHDLSDQLSEQVWEGVKGVDKVYHCGGEKLSHWYDDKGVQGE